MRTYFIPILSSLFLCLPASADFIWDYTSTDGVDTVTGQLTTDGNAPDALLAGETFFLLSIDNVSLNGTLLSGADWFSSSDPPFTTTNGTDSITTTGTTGAVLADQLQISANDGVFNSILLGQAGVVNGTGAAFTPGFLTLFQFTPTSTTFQAQGTGGGGAEVPEPSSILYLGLVGPSLAFALSSQKECNRT